MLVYYPIPHKKLKLITIAYKRRFALTFCISIFNVCKCTNRLYVYYTIENRKLKHCFSNVTVDLLTVKINFGLVYKIMGTYRTAKRKKHYYNIFELKRYFNRFPSVFFFKDVLSNIYNITWKLYNSLRKYFIWSFLGRSELVAFFIFSPFDYILVG